jgi:hypothetical protein
MSSVFTVTFTALVLSHEHILHPERSRVWLVGVAALLCP